MGEYLLRGGVVVSVDPAIGTLPRGDVHVRDGEIVAVGTALEAPGAELIDASGMIVMPGLVDSHHHMWSALGRNFISEGFEYYPAKWATSALYEPADFRVSVLLGLVECVRAGITTVHNWSHNTRTPTHADAELEAHREGLVRARYSYGHRDLLPEDEPLDFTDIDRVSAEWFAPGSLSPFEGLLHLGVNLRGPDVSDVDVFHTEMAAAQARGLPVSIHTSQGRTTAVSGPDLEARGYLGPAFLLCHYLPATHADREAMVRTDASLSFAMHSELRLGDAGDPRSALLQMLADGVNVSLSTDATSLAPVNLFEAMSVAWNLGIPWPDRDPDEWAAITFRQCIEMATINGARALGLADVTGSITPGKRADLIMLRAHDVNLAPVVDVESSIVRSATPANVDTVMVDGRILKRRGELVAFDVERVVHEAEDAAHRIRSKAGRPLAPAPGDR